ncbi:SSR4-like protein [Mya arenaria]|uniref:SSR4-like protein n=1 Tax=Mya arenaria TaxID=6604 RepID=A0ABY7G003_MYAAR|nr:somatostatin receptor type 4-like [Mya arenaria]WAR27212.1 SSR4-like protein [Mya arenaria]
MSSVDNITAEEAEGGDYESDHISPSLFLFAKYITIYLQPVICTAGLLGNFISFCVFLSKGMRKISSNLYLAALSGSGFGFNVVLFFQWLEFVHIPIIHMQGFCQAIVYLGYIFSFLSVWLIVCITVENYIVTFHLSKAVIYCTVFRAKVVIGILIMFSVILYSGQFWTTSVIEVYENYTICTEVNEYAQLNRIYYFWDTITTMVLPIIITSVLIVAILSRNLFTSQNIGGRDNSIYRRLSKKQKCLVRITRVLLAISLTFVILSGPTHANKLRHLILTELNGAQRPYTLSDRVLQQIFQIIYYLSSCLNIVYYLIWSHNFRKEIRRLLCLIPGQSESGIRGLENRSKTKSNNETNQMGKGAKSGCRTIVDKPTNPKSQITML